MLRSKGCAPQLMEIPVGHIPPMLSHSSVDSQRQCDTRLMLLKLEPGKLEASCSRSGVIHSNHIDVRGSFSLWGAVAVIARLSSPHRETAYSMWLMKWDREPHHWLRH